MRNRKITRVLQMNIVAKQIAIVSADDLSIRGNSLLNFDYTTTTTKSNYSILFYNSSEIHFSREHYD